MTSPSVPPPVDHFAVSDNGVITFSSSNGYSWTETYGSHVVPKTLSNPTGVSSDPVRTYVAYPSSNPPNQQVPVTTPITVIPNPVSNTQNAFNVAAVASVAAAVAGVAYSAAGVAEGAAVTTTTRGGVAISEEAEAAANEAYWAQRTAQVYRTSQAAWARAASMATSGEAAISSNLARAAVVAGSIGLVGVASVIVADNTSKRDFFSPMNVRPTPIPGPVPSIPTPTSHVDPSSGSPVLDSEHFNDPYDPETLYPLADILPTDTMLMFFRKKRRGINVFNYLKTQI